MAWTAPITWVGGQIPTAALLNAQLRDNLLETMPAKATQEGQIFVGNGANSITTRTIQAQRISTSQSTSSTSYTNLATVGPSVTVTHGSFMAVFHSCAISNSTTNGPTRMSWEMTGSNVRAPLDITAIFLDGVPGGNALRLGNVDILQNMNPGTTTFTAKYNVDSGTGTFSDRFLAVIPF